MGVIEDQLGEEGLAELEEHASKIEGIVSQAQTISVPSINQISTVTFFKLEGIEQDHYFSIPPNTVNSGDFVKGYVSIDEPEPVDSEQMPSITSLPVLKLDVFDKQGGQIVHGYFFNW